MKKKLITMILAGCMVLSLAACGSDKDKNAAQNSTNTESDGQSVLGSSKLEKLAEYKGLGYVPMSIAVTDEEVDSEIQYMLMMTTNKENQDTVTENSVVNIDYVGTKDGVAFDGGTAQGQQLDIANSHYIDGFAESIVGMKVGETKDCPMTFPENYGVEELNGAEVVFTITVNECWTEVPSELNDEFAVSNGYENLDALYAGVRSDYEEYKKTQAESDKYTQLFTKLVEESTFSINEEEVQLYVDRTMKEQEGYAQQYGFDMENYVSMYGMTLEEFEESCRENAIYQIKVPLVQFAIAEKEGLEVTDEDYQNLASQLMVNYGYSDLASFEDAYDKEIIKKMVLAELAVNVVMDNAVEEEAVIPKETVAAGE